MFSKIDKSVAFLLCKGHSNKNINSNLLNYTAACYSKYRGVVVGCCKVTYFFISPEKFIFDHFWGKTQRLSKHSVFFWYCFFPASELEYVNVV